MLDKPQPDNDMIPLPDSEPDFRRFCYMKEHDEEKGDSDIEFVEHVEFPPSDENRSDIFGKNTTLFMINVVKIPKTTTTTQ